MRWTQWQLEEGPWRAEGGERRADGGERREISERSEDESGVCLCAIMI